MAKQDEIDYPIRIGAAMTHAAAKPFSDRHCASYLIRLGTLMALCPRTPARILDLGCGTGWTSTFFARAGYTVVGVDIAPEMIRLANEQNQAEGLANLTFAVSDYEHLASREEFDAVVFFDSLHHADNEQLALRQAHAALKPRGLCIAVEPGCGHHDSEEARTAIAAHGVTEKDMPPEYIVNLGRTAGFLSFRVFPLPDQLNKAIYTDHRPVPDPFREIGAEGGDGQKRTLWSRFRYRFWLAFAPSGRWRRTVDDLFYSARKYGLVVLSKDEATSTQPRIAA